MQDESGAKGLNPMLEKHWEKLVLGLVVAAGLVFVGAKFSGGGNTVVKDIDNLKVRLATQKEQDNPRIDPPKAGTSPVIAAVVAADRSPIWSGSTRTIFTPDIRIEKKEAATFHFPTVTLNPLKPGFEGIELSWVLSNEQPNENQKSKPAVPKANTFFFQIERRKKGDPDFSIIVKDQKGDKLTYIDPKTLPKTEYEYKVTLGSTDNQWQNKNPKGLTDKVAGPLSARTPGIWTFDYSQHTPAKPDDEPPTKGSVWVKIVKHDPEAGRVEWTRIHFEEAPLGFGNEGGVSTSVHQVWSEKKKRMVSVDFNCGGKIVKVEAERPVPHSIKVCKGLDHKEPEKVAADYRVNVVTYIDEEGKRVEDKKISGSEPQSDQLCEEHGGVVRKEPTAEEKAAAREEQAAKLIKEADELWASAKPADKRKAQDHYKKLVDSFGDTKAVKPRRAELGERAKAKITE